MANKILPLEPIATFTHNFRSHSPLFAWPPVPADDFHQAEQIAGKTFESLMVPRHFYHAVWEDASPDAWRLSEQDKPPATIRFLACFGVAPYELRSSLIEAAEIYNRLDRANLRLEFIRDEDNAFRPKLIILEMTDPSSEIVSVFRSDWRGAEVNTLDLSLQFDAPLTRREPFRFHIRGRLPRRLNQTSVIEKEHVEFIASGGAMPRPQWLKN
jgi:hypothetical protein